MQIKMLQIKMQIKKHFLVFLILILALTYFHNLLPPDKIMKNVHYVNDVTFVSQNLKEALLEHGQLHLWTPYYYSGRPLYAQPEYSFLELNFLYLLIFRNIFTAMKLAALSYFFLAGLGMYLLFLTFKDDKKGAFIASALYMFNGYIHSFIIGGNLNVLAGYSLVPFAFMFFVKALQGKNYFRDSILCGLFIALQLFAGGTLLMPYEIVLFGTYVLIYLIGKSFSKRILKLVIAGAILIAVSFGISAIKLLPGIEFMELSNRSAGVSYQEYLGEPILMKNLAHVFITNRIGGGISASIGIAGFVLLLFCLSDLKNYKKRHVIFSLAIILISLLMSTESFFSKLLFNLPAFSQMRHIERSVFLLAIALPLLAGTGLEPFYDKIKRIIKLKKEIFFSLIVILILTEVLFLQNFPQSKNIEKPEDIELIDFISQDKARFRTINLALETLIGGSGYNYLSQLKIGEIKGGSGIWFNDYITYLDIAERTEPAKLWGLLNNKYVISSNPDEHLKINGLKFIREFKKCDECIIWEASGPYLYENTKFMPRAFFVERSVLVVGKDEDAWAIIYSILTNGIFEPKRAVLIKGMESINGYSQDEIGKYDAVMLPQEQIEPNIQLLKNYIDNKGIILPYLIAGAGNIQMNINDVDALFKNINGSYMEVEIEKYSNNEVIYNLGSIDKNGYLVLSERFSGFPGWNAVGKAKEKVLKKEILISNGITTAVYTDRDEKITLTYAPESFKKGGIITIVSSSILAVIFILFIANKFRKFRGGKNKISS